MVDYLVYGVIALVALGPAIWPQVQRLLANTTTKEEPDWRQPWVAKLMDLEVELTINGNDAAATTAKKLLTEIIYDGEVE